MEIGVARLGWALLMSLAAATGAGAQTALPPQMSWTAYDTGSAGFNITVAIGQAFKQAYHTDIRVLPAGNDVGRLAPVRTGRAAISAMGIGAYMAQEGMFEFGSREWGPQPLRLMLAAKGCEALSLAVARDANVKSIAELKGKRVGIVIGAPALNQGTYAILAFAGLSRNDVRLVEFSSYGAMQKGILNDEIDAYFATTISGRAREVESSPRGLVWPPLSAADTPGWERLRRMAPYFVPNKATCGAGGMSPATPLDLPTYPYPIMIAYADQNEKLVYAITKGLLDQYDTYKDAAPGADGFELKRQNLAWVIPYHAGAVRALREAGVWTAAAEKHNDALVQRQNVLAMAWKAFLNSNPPDAEFYERWMKARAEALRRAGLELVFE